VTARPDSDESFPDIATRRPVWTALAELFLDTETEPLEPHITTVLAGSPYAVAEIERTLVHEVCPVCGRNLASPAGVWAGFDPVWLESEIRTARRRGRLPWVRWWRELMGRLLVARWSQWRRIRAAVESARAGPGPAA
jgi:hypothetical protein